MLSVLSKQKQGCPFYYELLDGDAVFHGGMNAEGVLFCDQAGRQKELMHRTLVFRCINEGVPAVYARDEWGVDLARFGFVREGGLFCAALQNLCLPHDCGAQKRE